MTRDNESEIVVAQSPAAQAEAIMRLERLGDRVRALTDDDIAVDDADVLEALQRLAQLEDRLRARTGG